MPLSRLSSTLAAKRGIRSIELHVKADEAANAADRVVVRTWRALMRLLKMELSPEEAFYRALKILKPLPQVLTFEVGVSLNNLAMWGHYTAVDTLAEGLPLEALKAAAGSKADGSYLENRQRVEVRNGRWPDLSVPIPEAVRIHDPCILAAQRDSRSQQELTEAIADPGAPLREPAASMTEAEKRALFASLLFPTPPQNKIDAVVYSGDWQRRLGREATKLSTPDALAKVIANGYAAGKDQRAIAKDLLPEVQNVKSTARRIGRTEGIRVAHAMQMEADEQLGDLCIGWQIHATHGPHSRAWHQARSGTIYYKRPKAGQKGLKQMPRPPQEAEDASERPANTPSTAFNCLCYLSPVLRPAGEILDDPDKLQIFHTNAKKVVPDPLTYSEWFARAPEKQRRVAVGAKRYSVVKDVLGGAEPLWMHFLNPDTGTLLTIAELKAETPQDLTSRLARVVRMLDKLRKLLTATATFGFVPPEKGKAGKLRKRA